MWRAVLKAGLLLMLASGAAAMMLDTTTVSARPTTVRALSPSTALSGIGYTPLTPGRILDTRPGETTIDGVAQGGGVVGQGETLNLVVTGRAGVPATGVSAVVLNVTAVDQTRQSFLTVFPAGAPRPLASNLNPNPGIIEPNLVIAKVGAGGEISIYNNTGSVNLVADVEGWFPLPLGPAYAPLAPARVLDTRPGNVTVDGVAAGGGNLTAGSTIDLTVTGRGGVPSTGVGAVVLNVTAVDQTARSFVTVFPTGSPRPNSSDLNPNPGVTAPNLVIAMVGAGGQVSIYNNAGEVNLVADVQGWFPSGPAYTSLTPARLLETRAGFTTIDGVSAGGGPVGPNSMINVKVTGRAGVPASGVGAVALNVTAADQTNDTYLTVFPAGSPRPIASNLNPFPGLVAPNMVIAKVGANGEVSIYNRSGTVNVIADVHGWFPSDIVTGDDAAMVLEDSAATPIDVLANDTVTDGGPKTIASASSPAHGFVALTGGSPGARTGLTYTPDANYCNTPPGTTLDTFTYTLNGGAPANVSVTVTCVNDAPTFTKGPDQNVGVNTGPHTVPGWAAAVSAGPADESAQVVDFIVSNGSNALFSTQPAISAAGDLTFAAAPGASGSAIVTVKAHDDGGAANGGVDTSAPQTFVIKVNGPPVAAPVITSTLEDTPATITLTGTDNEGDSLTFAIVTPPTAGTLGPIGSPTCAGAPSTCTATVSYTPNLNSNGTDTFTFKVNDGSLDSGNATVTVNVTPVNDAPGFTAGADSTVLEDAGPQTVNGWASAISAGPANEAAQTLTFTATNDNNALFSAPPAVNAVTGNLTYTPASNANGSAVVSVHISDNGGTANGGVDTSPTQMFTITVTAVNDPPAVPNPTFAAQANMKVSIAAAGLLAGATDPDSGDGGYTFTPVVDAASVTATTPAGGTISNVNVNTGSFDFDPPPGVTGAVTFQYRICDNGNPLPRQCSALATATVNVSGPVIWFVNPAVAGPGDGRLSNPFKFLSGNAGPANDADDVDAANQNIFVYSGTVTSGITLNAFESLIGQGVSGASFDALYGITPPAGTIARPTIATGGTTVQGTVALATNSTVRALAITPTGANQGLTGAGGLTGVTVSETSVTTTTGTAVSLSNVAGTISLRSVSSNGAPNGINLTATQGSFTVTGTGTAGSGGTIQASTDSGIQANGAANLNLSWMTIQNNGNALNEGGIRLVNVTGSGQLTSSTVTGSFEDNVYLSNTGGVPLTAFNIQGPNCSIGNNNTTFGNTGVFVLAKNTATMSVTVDNCAFSGNRTDTIHTDAADSSNLTSTITNNTITAGTGGANQGNIGINVTAALTSTLTYDVENNKIGTNGGTNSPLLNHGVNVFAGNSATVSGKVIANTIVLAGAGMSGTGIRVFQSDSGSLSAKVVNNTVSNVGLDYGIDATDNGTLNVATTGKLNIGVVNNNVSVLSTAINAIHVRGRRDTTTCASITGNTATTNGGGNALHVSQANTATYNLEVPSPLGSMTAAQAQTAETSLNPAAVGVEAFSATGFTGVAVGGCTGIPS